MIDTKSLLRWLRPEFEVLADKAFEGDLNAWNDLGLGLLSKWLDDGDDISLDRSVSCFLYAAKKGHAKAQFNLAMTYLAGFRMRNYLRSVEWFRRSAENGEPWAMYMMGLMEEIVVVGKDEGADIIDRCHCDEALAWYSRAASGGNAYAKLAIALAEDMGHAPKATLQHINDECRGGAELGGHWEFPLLRHNYEKACGLYEQAWKAGLDWGFVRARRVYLMEILGDVYEAAHCYLEIIKSDDVPSHDDFLRFVDGWQYESAEDFPDKNGAIESELWEGRIQDGVFLCSGILQSLHRYISQFSFAGAYEFAAHSLLRLSCNSRAVSISSDVRRQCYDILQGFASYMHGGCAPTNYDYDGDGGESYSECYYGDILTEALWAGMANLAARSRCRNHRKMKFYRYDSFINPEGDSEWRVCGVDEDGVVYYWVSALRKFVRSSWTRDKSVYNMPNKRRVSLGRVMGRLKRREKFSEEYCEVPYQGFLFNGLFNRFRSRESKWQSYVQWMKEYWPYDDFSQVECRVKRDCYSKVKSSAQIITSGITDMSCGEDPEEEDEESDTVK